MSIKIKGADKLLRKLDKLANKDSKRINRAATRSAAGAMAKEIKPNVPVDKGVTKKATSYKVYGKGVTMGGVAGADLAKMTGTDDIDRPYNVDFLLEYGHVAPDGTFVPPSGYFRRAAPDAVEAGHRVYIARLKDLIDEATG